MSAEASVIIVSYNSRQWLPACLDSVLNQPEPPLEVIIADNASTDGTVAFLQQAYPAIRVLALGRNEGFGSACNQAAAQARGSFLAFLNPDTVVESGWMKPLIAALCRDPSIGAVSPKIVLMDDPSTINACGNDVHVMGFPSCRHRGLLSESIQEAEETASISGAAFVMTREQFLGIGGFNADYFLYLEDTDLSWRLRLSGKRCWCEPSSVVRHAYAPSFPPEKFEHLERNRRRLIVTHFSPRTRAALAPARWLTNAYVWIYAILRGPRYVQARRRASGFVTEDVSTERSTAHEAELLKACAIHLPHDVVGGGWIRAVASGFAALVSGLCRKSALGLLARRRRQTHLPQASVIPS